MRIARSTIESYVASLPESVEAEDVMYRLYLLEKIAAGEEDLRAGRVVAHADAVERLARKWQS